MIGARYRAREPEADDPYNVVRCVAIAEVPSLDPAHTAHELVIVPDAEDAFAAPLSVSAEDLRRLFVLVEAPVAEPAPWTTPVEDLIR